MYINCLIFFILLITCQVGSDKGCYRLGHRGPKTPDKCRKSFFVGSTKEPPRFAKSCLMYFELFLKSTIVIFKLDDFRKVTTTIWQHPQCMGLQEDPSLVPRYAQCHHVHRCSKIRSIKSVARWALLSHRIVSHKEGKVFG